MNIKRQQLVCAQSKIRRGQPGHFDPGHLHKQNGNLRQDEKLCDWKTSKLFWFTDVVMVNIIVM